MILFQNLVIALCFQYLDALFCRDANAGQSFHSRQVELYATFEPKKLLSFLRSSTFYPLHQALKICEEKRLVPEMVFLLGKLLNFYPQTNPPPPFQPAPSRFFTAHQPLSFLQNMHWNTRTVV